MTLALILAALLAVACVTLVALPFLREPETSRDRLNEPDEATRRRLALVEERDRALEALRELELDHRTGKVSDEDYHALHGSLRRQAAEALQAVSEGLIRVDRSLQTERGQSPRS
jgi:transposase